MDTGNVDVIIIRGAPGTGKSQVAKRLAKFYPKGIRLEVDAIRSMVISVDWANQNEHIQMLDISRGLLSDFIKSGYGPVLVIDTFSGDKLDRYLNKIVGVNKNLRVMVFGLYCTEEELESRLRLRPDKDFKNYQVSRKLNADVLKYRHSKEYQIDTSSLSPNEVATMMYKHVIDTLPGIKDMKI